MLTSSLTKHLRNPSLFASPSSALGRECARSRDRFSVHNPSTGEVLAELMDADTADVLEVIDRASDAQAKWAARPARGRSDLLSNWHRLIVENVDDLASILTAEMGKPLEEARSEISHAAAYIRWYAEEANRIYGETISPPSDDRRLLVIKQPVGVVGAITPWNFPASMVARKISPALAAGCSVVLKPAEQTPIVAGAILRLAELAGFPDGVVNLIYSTQGNEVGRTLCSSAKVRKISFTGSTEVGRLLMRQCSDQIKSISLELGGSAPFIVFNDANVDSAVDGAVQAKFRNAGQACVSANRFYIQSSIYDEFYAKFVDRVRALHVGDGFDPRAEIGPLIDNQALTKIESLVRDAVAKGAIVRCGGNRVGATGTFFEPTVITEVTPCMRLAQDEIFGPIAAIIPFDEPETVIRQANDTIYGLAAYFYASDHKRIWRVAEALECGMIGINTGRMSSEAAPFGGMKQSGIGREGSRHGLDDYLEVKYICMGGL
ncbi:NAD-dependent succinate-semialdehyde dehydrogenase [Rhizobium binae]|uniref:NAD-dependent succinate-semialdehyde dehydrogenase n=1 Tax=Rhizobium binae TaxID=1138190 RepID=UPI003DA84DCD